MIFKSQMDHRPALTALKHWMDVKPQKPTKRVRRMNKCRGGEFMAADQVSTYSLCYTTHANADFNAGRSTNSELQGASRVLMR